MDLREGRRRVVSNLQTPIRTILVGVWNISFIEFIPLHGMFLKIQ